MSDPIAVLTWWILVQVFSCATLPLTFRLFWRLPDRGYGMAKALGLLLPNYVFWLLGVLGFLRNDTGGILFSLAVTAGAALLFYSRSRNRTAPTLAYTPDSTLLSWLRQNWKLILVIEVVFALTFGGWAVYRAYVPRIMTAGGEKFMELAFLNGIKRSASLPPIDPWLSGYGISYYYFGYLMMSNLIRLSGVEPAVGFNIGGALLFALASTGAFSLVYNLIAGSASKAANRVDGVSTPEQSTGDGPSVDHERQPQNKWIWMALLGAVFLVLLSNFEGPLEVAHWKGLGTEGMWKWLDIDDLDQPQPTEADAFVADRLTRPGWWWWRASRVVFDYDLRDWDNRLEKTSEPPPVRRENIDEFPFFSYLLGDMHPHVLALPFVLLAMTVSLSLFHAGIRTRYITGSATTAPQDQDGSVQRKAASWTVKRSEIPHSHLLIFALIFGALGFLNTWDLPIQWAVAMGAYILGLITIAGQDRLSTVSRAHLRPILALASTLSVGGLLLYAPFFIGFQSQAGGPLVHVHSSTRLSHFAVMFGPLLCILVGFLVWGVQRARTRQDLALRSGLMTTVVLLSLALAILLATSAAVYLSESIRALVAPALASEDPGQLALRYLSMRLSTPWVTLLLAGVIGVSVALLRSAGFDMLVRFSLLLVVAGAAMTLAPEYIYLKDVFGVRLNTVFKFYYQAWVLWAVAAAGAVYSVFLSADGLRSRSRSVCLAGLAVVVGLGLVYPVLAIGDRVKEFPEAPTLDGTAYLASEHASDYAAVQWLNAHVEGAPTILETPGGAYQYEGRVSAQTGLPTLLGWIGHENQWRGNTLEQDKRRPVIDELCRSTDYARTLTLLYEYDITYVYVGPLERANCPASGLQKFDGLMEIVYDRDGVTIYKRRGALGSRLGE